MAPTTCFLAAGGALIALLAQAAIGNSSPAASAWLQWTRGAGAESCIDAAAFAARVEGELGPRAGGSAATRPKVAITVARAPSGGGARPWLADLRLVAPDGTPAGSRHLERAGDSCDVLTDRLALVVALLLAGEGDPAARREAAGSPDAGARDAGAGAGAGDAVARDDAGAPVPAPITMKQPPASPRSPTVADRSAAAGSATTGAAPSRRGGGDSPPSRPWTWAIETGASAGLGSLPRLAVAVEGRLWVTPGRGPTLFATGSAGLSQRALVEGTDASGADLDLWTAGLGVCPLTSHATDATAFFACLVGDVGSFDAVGFGFGQTRSGRHWTADVGVEGDIRQPLSRRTFVAFGLRLVAPLVRDAIVYRQDATSMSIFRVAPVVATAALRLGAVFP
jgi:hypothetical protein